MFVHSVKVPRLYKTAAKILQEVKENGGSLKQLLYTNKYSNVKAIYALVVETLKHFSQIDAVIEQSQLLIKENRLNPWLARILITELLWNEKPLPGESKPMQTIMSYHDELKKHKLTFDTKAKQKITKKVEKPRFVRINTLLTTLEEAINGFREEGWTLMPSSSQSYDEYLSKANSLRSDEFMVDLHLKEVLLFACNTEFYKHYAYKNGLIILQDKASCLPARLLNPPPGSTVLDMCAAPGMKTTHLAALLNNEGTVYAIERDAKRFQTLNSMVENAGATCVKAINKDVLQITAEDCPNVEYILVDPSCSGSGIANRIELNDEDTTADPGRLRGLTRFQGKILQHALTSFPHAKRVIYSTCSVYPEENENIVIGVENISDFKLVSAKHLLNGPWKSSESSHHNSVREMSLFTKPEEDLTNGFFIAVFERDESQVNKAIELASSLTKASHEKKRKKGAHIDEEASLELIKDKVLGDKTKDEVTNTAKKEHESDSLAPKKKKKKNKKEAEEITFNSENSTGNHKNVALDKECTEELNSNLNVHKKHKKKKSKEDKEHSIYEELTESGEVQKEKRKKKKKSKSVSEIESADNSENQVDEESIKKKRKKHKKKKE